MADKSTFSDLVSSEAPLPSCCCGHCRHGVLVRNAQVLEAIVECRAHPKVPLLMPTRDGPALTYQWPMMRQREQCGDFDPKSGTESMD